MLFFLVPTGLDSFESEAKSGTSVCRNSQYAFSQGISAHNSSLAGWGGHLSNGGVKASVKEVLDAVIINKPSEVRLSVDKRQQEYKGRTPVKKILSGIAQKGGGTPA